MTSRKYRRWRKIQWWCHALSYGGLCFITCPHGEYPWWLYRGTEQGVSRMNSDPQPAADLQRTIGDLLRKAIEAKRLSQAQFAREVGASAKHVNRVLSGQEDIRLATLAYWGFCLDMRFDFKLVPTGEAGSYKVLDTNTSGYLPPSAREHGLATWEWRKYKDGHEEQVLIEWHRYKEGEAPWDPDFLKNWRGRD